MPKNISAHRSLLIVSDTGMMIRDETLFGFGPVVLEINAFLTVFDTVTWIGFDESTMPRAKSFLKVDARVTPILFKKVGGKHFKNKAAIVSAYPKMYRVLKKEITKHQYIHLRAPSNPAFISMGLSRLYPDKKFWFKYAGDWQAKTSFFYNLQRKTLKNLGKNSVVTINGNWEQENKQILSFENPCIDLEQLKENEKLILEKVITEKINYCFVGNLNDNKGIELLIRTWMLLAQFEKHVLHVVGGGYLAESLLEITKNYKGTIIFHGNIPKTDVHEIYKKCHFTILPSKSEGFPKVIGEAMSYGCVPIVSNISCIPNYVVDNKNGFLINNINTQEVENALLRSFDLDQENFYKFITNNNNLALEFTYEYYIDRIKNKIFLLP